MDIQAPLRPDPLPWLLDPADPGPRYLALRDLVGLPPQDPELLAARTAAHLSGPIAEVLGQMDPSRLLGQAGTGLQP
jgi:hypothetical protein